MFSRVDRIHFKEYTLAMVLRTTPWSKSSSDTFDVDDGSCFVCCCSSCVHNFLSGRSANASECCSPVPYKIQGQIHSRLFCSMQNLYTFSIKALALTLYLRTSFAILLSDVALHVHNTSKHAFSANM